MLVCHRLDSQPFIVAGGGAAAAAGCRLEALVPAMQKSRESRRRLDGGGLLRIRSGVH